jgi:Tol biopolymer transport system component
MNPVSEHTKLFERAAARYEVPELSTDALLRRRDRQRRNQRIRAGALGLAIAIALGWLGVNAIRSTPPAPADDRSEELGIFGPVAGRIVFVKEGVNDATAQPETNDLGYARGLWAVDPDAPRDTVEGPTVADDVASALVRLGPGDMIPLGWSRDGTELLFKRTSGDLFPKEYLYILHANGSETQVTTEPIGFGGATIAPDGSRVVFVAWGDELGLYAVAADGGTPEVLLPGGVEDSMYAPTFSPDGTQIAYVRGGGDHDHHVWVMDADGTDAHEILAVPTTGRSSVSGLEWSPAGDRIAIGLRGLPAAAIYTFAPDGSDFTQVVTDANEPHWSSDGSKIAFEHEIVAPCPNDRRYACFSEEPSEGLGIANADGSQARTFGFADSGPWHPGTSDDPTSEGEAVLGWPDTSKNPPGVYSWDGSSCASTYCSVSSAGGFMHNGYGSGDVEIRLDVLPEETISDDGATAVTIAGHDGIYRRIDAGREEWIVDIEGTTIAIRLTARPGTSQTDLADAYAIIESMRTEAQDNDLGFRLVFTLMTNDWDSG